MKNVILFALIAVALLAGLLTAWDVRQLERRLADYDHVAQDAACAWHKDLNCPPPLPVRKP